MHKEAVITIGESLSRKTGLPFVVPIKIEQTLHTAGFYKQNYCGCAYSLIDRLEAKNDIGKEIFA